MQNSIARRALLLLLAPLAVVPCNQAQSTPAADLAITNAKVWTVDPTFVGGKLVWESGGKILGLRRETL